MLKPSGKFLPPEAVTQRAKLEEAIEALRKQKAKLPENEYYAQLELLMRQLAQVYGG